MRELNNTEITAVSGSGALADMGKVIGSAIGGVVDMGTSLGGLTTNAATPAGELGYGLGGLIEMNFLDAFTNIGSGLFGFVKFGIDAIYQFKN